MIFSLTSWYISVFEDIENTLGKYIKTNIERVTARLCTHAHICVEIDLSKGLSNKMILKRENFQWTQVLPYENTTFGCWIYQQTRYLQNIFPWAWSHPKEKGPKPKKKSWHFLQKSMPIDEGDQEDELQQTSNIEKVNTTCPKVSNEETIFPMETREEAQHQIFLP